MVEAQVANDMDTGMKRREEGMAKTIAWIRDTEPHDDIAIWAHNAHVKRGDYRYPAYGLEDVPSLGKHLVRTEGITYAAVGFSVTHDEARVISQEDGGFKTVTTEDPHKTQFLQSFQTALANPT